MLGIEVCRGLFLPAGDKDGDFGSASTESGANFRVTSAATPGSGGGKGEIEMEDTVAEWARYTQRDWNVGSARMCCFGQCAADRHLIQHTHNDSIVRPHNLTRRISFGLGCQNEERNGGYHFVSCHQEAA